MKKENEKLNNENKSEFHRRAKIEEELLKE